MKNVAETWHLRHRRRFAVLLVRGQQEWYPDRLQYGDFDPLALEVVFERLCGIGYKLH